MIQSNKLIQIVPISNGWLVIKPQHDFRQHAMQQMLDKISDITNSGEIQRLQSNDPFDLKRLVTQESFYDENIYYCDSLDTLIKYLRQSSKPRKKD